MMPHFIIAIIMVILGVVLLVSEIRQREHERMMKDYEDQLEEY